MGPTIISPLHILHLSQPDTPQIALFKAPDDAKSTSARSPELDTSTHEISTAYYSASIPIWRDTLPFTPATLSAWKEEWSAPEAREVVRAVGAWVVTFRKARNKGDMRVLRDVLGVISSVIECHATATDDELKYVMDEEEKPLLLAVGMQLSGNIPADSAESLDFGVEEWEDLFRECGGWEWVDGTVEEKVKVDQRGWEDGGGKMKSTQRAEEEEEDGEIDGYREKVGIARLKEALEAHEWESRGGDDFEGLDDLGFGGDDDDASLGFGEEAMEAQMEIWGMQSEVRKEEEEEEEEEGQRVDDDKEGTEHDTSQIGDQDVQELETMMLKMQAVRDMGADMAEGERKKFAAKAVREVLKKM